MKEEERQAKIKEYLFQEPGISGAQIFGRFVDESRATKWFGRNSFLAEIFGASIGKIYVSLARMEKTGTIRSQWEDGPRPRRRKYFLVTPVAHEGEK